MTLDFTIPCETESLIRTAQVNFYPVRIPVQHHQLKNYISSKDPNVVYYASQHEVYVLYIPTRERRLIKSLPWDAQCLDAGHGWICVGGRYQGQCAFINIDEGDHGASASRRRTEVDDLLPLDLEPSHRRPLADQTLVLHRARASRESSSNYELQTHELGGEIMNSVTIHLLRSEQKGLDDDIVVVMTNNDQTVRIFSLTQSRLLANLDFPTAMNHASISPDGKLLLAVGDEPIAFFCRRIRLSSTASNGGVSRLYATYQWNEIARSKLRLTDSSDVCFSTAFSPSGHICAVASQSGIITIYDTALIHEDMDADEAVITVLKSSQPSFNPSFTGAVRSMSFSPAPWDLLAWAEDQGRLCVVDLRNACRSRQTIELKIDSPVLVRAEGEDHDTNSQQQLIEIERRYMQRHREALAAQDQLASASRTADQVELAAERRRIELDTERQMIPSIGLRPLVNHTNYSDTLLSTPISVNYNQTSARQTEPRDGTQPSSPSAQSRSTANIHEFMRQRNWERSRENERSHQPRRRGSVAISNSNSNSNTSAPYTFSLAPIGIETQNLSTSPARLPSNTSNEATTNDSTPINPADPWHTIADAMGSLNSPVDTVTRLRNLQSRNSERRMHSPQFPQAREQTMAEQVDGVEARVNRARDATARALRQMRAAHGRAGIMYDEIDREFILRRYQRSPRGVDAAVMTMGIGWNEDGRSLFVATEEGILEYPVNLDGRKTFPSVSFL